MKTTTLRVAFLQYPIRFNKPKKNLQHVRLLINKVKGRKPDLIMLPEVCLGSPLSKKWRPVHLDCYREFKDYLKKTARTDGVCFFGSLYEEKNKKYFNTAFFVSPSGQMIAGYQKLHLFRLEHEHKNYSPGLHSKIYQTPWGRAVPLICYDIRFPELARKQVFRGATLALVCAQWPRTRQEHWLSLLQARALENQIFVLACNRIGTGRHLQFAGGSCVVSPWGVIQYQMGRRQEIGVFDLNLNEINKIRRTYPFLKDAYKDKFRFDI